ncbi:tripartite tricarboxylate transporter substrate binding protein [Acidovorax sp. CCYZU-2555]|uniref:Bug family tripartite tricarboxylate transporter substrate binding protein n=1 Tax=Acidovorax sp. CCYZU-2555 TaxID=2835042 RepID=UPI001BCEDA4A|nr:tripartite tricarboxylate transporter substrate binding protein [Acidovorax sp. CCYZU-2555]MBS7776791.1 tripartite tricarboxylate transporter substrate binding protein [Acidovorax sp. CCYZU-2555]
MNKRFFVSALALALAGLASVVQAQVPYPAKTVKLIVPFSAGGSTDLVARQIAQEMTVRTGQPFVVENKPGAGSTIGADFVAKAPADGYTLLLGTISSHATAVGLYPKLPYDPLKDFAAITEITAIPNLIVASPTNARLAGVRNVADLVKLAKEKPGSLTYGSSGSGSSNHLATEQLMTAAGITMNHIPYKGSGPALNDVSGGHTDLMLDVVLSSLPQIKGGRLKALGITSLKRSPLLPDVPTVAEQGYPGFEVLGWYGLFAPAGTPPAVLERLSQDFRAVLRSDKMRATLESQGGPAIASTPAEFTALIRSEITRWKKVVEQSGIKPD